MNGYLIPLDLPLHHGGPTWGGGVPPFAPFLGVTMFLLFLLIAASVFFVLSRQGKIGPPPWVTANRAPEAEAKKILAERFATGDISAEDFMERASVLNWTPGSDNWQTVSRKRKR